MPNPSRSRKPFVYADARLTLSAVMLALSLPATSYAVSKKATPLPSMPAPVNHIQSSTTTTTTTTSTTAKSNSYNWAAPPPKLKTTTIYDGETAAKSGISVVAWGGGSGGDSTDVSYGHTGHAIKVVTHGLYEGVKMNFANPVTLGDMSVATNRTFQLLIRFGQPGGDSDEDTSKADSPLIDAPRAYAVSSAGRSSMFANAVYSPSSNLFRLAQAPGYIPRGQYPGFPQGQYAPRRPGVPNYPGGPGYPGQQGFGRVNPNADTTWNPAIHYFRLLFTLQNGAQAEIIRPTPWPGAFDDPDTAWLAVGVPLSLLKFNGDATSPLAGITIGGDGPATFYIGQINLVDDNAPIICSAGPTQDVAANDDVTFTARAQGGASALVYSWDFDASDGIIDEADGETTTHRFTKGDKDYTVTLTVSDLDGIKKPCTSTVKIKVEQ